LIFAGQVNLFKQCVHPALALGVRIEYPTILIQKIAQLNPGAGESLSEGSFIENDIISDYLCRAGGFGRRKDVPSEVSFITTEKSGNYVCSNDSRWYYFNSDGTMAANTIINGFLINENGVWYK
jgi:hypothetical protein